MLLGDRRATALEWQIYRRAQLGAEDAELDRLAADDLVVGLTRRHLPRRSDRQPQYLAQGRQIHISWSAVIGLPKVDTRCAHAHLLGNFNNRQPTLGPSIADIAGKIWLARQCTNPCC